MLWKWIKRLFKREHKHKWKTMKTLFPYPDGYADYCKGCNTVIDFRKEP